MPKLSIRGALLHVEDTGGGGEPVLFMHGLLFSGAMFDPQVEALKGRYRCIRFDFRGQGQSEVTRDGYDMDSLTQDALGVLDALRVGPVHAVGLSMGGFVGMRLAARHPERLRSLTLLETSAEPEPQANIPKYQVLSLAAQVIPLPWLMGQVLPIMAGRSTVNDPSLAQRREVVRSQLVKAPRRGLRPALHGVTSRQPVLDELPAIRHPTLVMVGEEDVATVPAKAERIHAAIPGSRLVRIPRAGHSSSLENPEFVTGELEQFLGSIG